MNYPNEPRTLHLIDGEVFQTGGNDVIINAASLRLLYVIKRGYRWAYGQLIRKDHPIYSILNEKAKNEGISIPQLLAKEVGRISPEYVLEVDQSLKFKQYFRKIGFSFGNALKTILRSWNPLRRNFSKTPILERIREEREHSAGNVKEVCSEFGFKQMVLWLDFIDKKLQEKYQVQGPVFDYSKIGDIDMKTLYPKVLARHMERLANLKLVQRIERSKTLFAETDLKNPTSAKNDQ